MFDSILIFFKYRLKQICRKQKQKKARKKPGLPLPAKKSACRALAFHPALAERRRHFTCFHVPHKVDFDELVARIQYEEHVTIEVGEPTPALAADTVKIGGIFDITGATSDVGADYAVAAKDAVAYINANGGINGKKLEMVANDYAYNIFFENNIARNSYCQPCNLSADPGVNFRNWTFRNTGMFTFLRMNSAPAAPNT